MGVIIFILVLGVIVFIGIKISNLKYRAQAHILKDTPFNESNINASIQGAFEGKYLENFLKEHPNYTEETVKEIFAKYTKQISEGNISNNLSEEVIEKMQKDSKLEKMRNMTYRRTNIYYYKDGNLKVGVFYTNNKDEYEFYMDCSIEGNDIKIEKYQIRKGSMVGF